MSAVPELGAVRTADLTDELVRELALADAGPYVSAHLRTDPRDPANTNHVPAWLITLRNGLRSIAEEIELRGSREERLAFRDAGPAIERDLTFLSATDRGRSVSYFAGPDGVLRITHQLALREEAVRWAARPQIAPLVDLAARGPATGLVLVGADSGRLLHWQGGRVEEPERSLFTLELGVWRDYRGPAAADPERGQRTATHAESLRQRVEDWRRRWVKDLADAVSDRTQALGWDRLLLAGATEHTVELARALPADVAARVVGHADVNVLGEAPAAVAERLEATLENVAAAEARTVLDRVRSAWAAGRPAAVGVDGVEHALLERRVEHLVLDPGHAGPAGDRAVEAALGAGSRITTLSAAEHPDLRAAGGMVATLRF